MKEKFVCGIVLKTGETEYFRLKDMPSFICTHGYSSDLLIEDLDGDFIANTFGVFLNKIDFDIRQLIIEDLVAMQTNELSINKNYKVSEEELYNENEIF